MTYVDPHKSAPTSPAYLAASLWRHRDLIGQMVRREVIGRYKGSVMGLAWSFLNPLLMLLIYTFVFSVVFKARWGGLEQDSRSSFAIVLFVGMIVHGLFAECVNRAPMLIVYNANFVKKVVFPLEILPVVALGSAMFHATVSMAVLLVAMVALGNPLHPQILFAPLLFAPLALATMGFTWLLASLGVFLRDIGQVTVIFTTALLFLSPVFYPTSAMPERYRALMQLNPLTFIIEQMRAVTIMGQMPAWGHYAIYSAVCMLAAWLGFWWFQKTRKGFSDVL